ncbi:RdRP-domain-containing protein [Mycena kentingensis (nom. inval.)]|nr:RdRP-domain-containing protein [Mycena kentingensis (nom. inval.)]
MSSTARKQAPRLARPAARYWKGKAPKGVADVDSDSDEEDQEEVAEEQEGDVDIGGEQDIVNEDDDDAQPAPLIQKPAKGMNVALRDVNISKDGKVIVAGREESGRTALEQEDESEDEDEKPPGGVKADESDESSEYESSSEEEEPPKPLFRPKFQPKRARETLVDRELEDPEEMQRKREAEAEERRKESHDMVAESIRRELAEKEKEEAIPDIDDTDGLDPEGEFEAWRLRELARIKKEKEEELRREEEREEVERRRALPEEQRMKEDLEHAQKLRDDKPKGQQKFLQKYWHKGAFHQDAEILQRHDFTEATESTVDVSSLPAVMQVKNFGKRSRTKYTHLVDQDTTLPTGGFGGTAPVKFGGQSTEGGGCFACGGPHLKKDCPQNTGPLMQLAGSGANAAPTGPKRSWGGPPDSASWRERYDNGSRAGNERESDAYPDARDRDRDRGRDNGLKTMSTATTPLNWPVNIADLIVLHGSTISPEDTLETQIAPLIAKLLGVKLLSEGCFDFSGTFDNLHFVSGEASDGDPHLQPAAALQKFWVQDQKTVAALNGRMPHAGLLITIRRNFIAFSLMLRTSGNGAGLQQDRWAYDVVHIVNLTPPGTTTASCERHNLELAAVLGVFRKMIKSIIHDTLRDRIELAPILPSLLHLPHLGRLSPSPVQLCFQRALIAGDPCVFVATWNGHFLVVKIHAKLRYGADAQRACAAYAPELYYEGPLGGDGVPDDYRIVVMQYVQGQRDIPRPYTSLEKACAESLNRFLHHLRREALVHGDLRPNNILFREDDEICVVDWDWAGRVGVQRYPRRLNPDVERRPGVEGMDLIQHEDDEYHGAVLFASGFPLQPLRLGRIKEIPEELLHRILLGKPKSMRLVCKRWNEVWRRAHPA